MQFQRILTVVMLYLLVPGGAWGQTLSVEIDRFVATQAGGTIAGPASDAEFLRRVTLDLAGTLPTPDETRKFLSDVNPGKRTQAIDRLLNGTDYPRRMAELSSVILLERRDGQLVSDAGWQTYLRESFTTNKPWNLLIRDLLAADGVDEKTRPGLRLMCDGGRGDPHVRTQDFARIFLGRNIQCAQCHDHPTVSDYLQQDYFGLFALLSPSAVHRNKQQQPLLIETVVREKLTFQSVFKPENKQSIGPRIPGGSEAEIPVVVAGQEFAVPPQDGLPGRPKFQPRLLWAEQLTAPTYRPFARTAVNRFWFELMGRGLVHPLDQDHSANPPSHPQLLDRLTDEFIAHNFDVRWLLRELALSATYQRSSQLPDGLPAASVVPSSYRVALPRPLAAEQLAQATAQALGHRTRLNAASPSPDSKFTYKDYVNGRLPPPENWHDVLVVFVGTFGHPAGQAEVDFRPSVEHALFLENDRLIAAWLQPTEATLTGRLQAMTDHAAVAEEIYLALLARLPQDAERAEINEILQSSSDRLAAIQDLCAGILSSAEFRLNH